MAYGEASSEATVWRSVDALALSGPTRSIEGARETGTAGYRGSKRMSPELASCPGKLSRGEEGRGGGWEKMELNNTLVPRQLDLKLGGVRTSSPGVCALGSPADGAAGGETLKPRDFPLCLYPAAPFNV